MIINNFQKWTSELDRETNWDKISSLQIISHLTEEIGELARSINRIFEYRGDIRQEHLENLKVELVDSF